LVSAVADSAASFLTSLDESGLAEAETPVDDFRKIGSKAIDTRSEAGDKEDISPLAASIGSDLVTRRKQTGKHKGKIVIDTSHFALTSGQQDLVPGMRKPAEKLAKRSKKGEIPAKVHDKIKEALIGPWLYRDEEHSLGWDPQVQRLHALWNKAPTNDDQNRSVQAAVFLASQALPLFPCFAVAGTLRTTGFHRDGGDDWFAWPIWREPISLDTLRSLIAHPFSRDLKRRGVEVVYRCRRAHTGSEKGAYHVFGNAEERAWPNRQAAMSPGRHLL
jgi:hypothetical protein